MAFAADEGVTFEEKRRRSAERKAVGKAVTSFAATVAKQQGAKPFPIAMQRLIRVTSEPEYRIDEVVRVVESDPLLASQLLAQANSSAYGLRVRCRSVHQAATLLGATAVRSIATTTGVMSMFNHVSSPVARAVVSHGALVGSVARRFAPLADLSSDELYTCGLLHDVGKLMLLDGDDPTYAAMLTEHRGFDVVHYLERERYDYDHALLGGHVLNAWNIPAPVPRVVGWHHQPARAFKSGGSVGKMVAVLRVADRVAYLLAAGEPSERAIAEALEGDESVAYLRQTPATFAGMRDTLCFDAHGSQPNSPRSRRPTEPAARWSSAPASPPSPAWAQGHGADGAHRPPPSRRGLVDDLVAFLRGPVAGKEATGAAETEPQPVEPETDSSLEVASDELLSEPCDSRMPIGKRHDSGAPASTARDAIALEIRPRSNETNLAGCAPSSATAHVDDAPEDRTASGHHVTMPAAPMALALADGAARVSRFDPSPTDSASGEPPPTAPVPTEAASTENASTQSGSPERESTESEPAHPAAPRTTEVEPLSANASPEATDRAPASSAEPLQEGAVTDETPADAGPSPAGGPGSHAGTEDPSAAQAKDGGADRVESAVAIPDAGLVDERATLEGSCANCTAEAKGRPCRRCKSPLCAAHGKGRGLCGACGDAFRRHRREQLHVATVAALSASLFLAIGVVVGFVAALHEVGRHQRLMLIAMPVVCAEVALFVSLALAYRRQRNQFLRR